MKLSLQHLYLIFALAVLPAGLAHAGTEVPAAKPAPKAVPLSGKVLETMDGGGYTYLRLKNGAENVWVAVPQMKVTVGQELTLVPGFEMKNFSSKGLNRKFDRVIFSSGVANQAVKLSPSAIKMVHQGVPGQDPKAAAPAKAENKAAATKSDAKPGAAKPATQTATAPVAIPRDGNAPGMKNVSNIKPAKIGHVAKAKGANAYTVAQLYEKRKALEKKPVVVRGKVVKVSSRILKRNWVHIQDGTGSEATKNNNLVVTTKDLPKEGDVVTVKGTMYNRLDFGYGYRYELIVQDAKIKK